MKTTLRLTLVNLWLVFHVSSQTIVSGPNVSGIWNLAGSPYLVQSNVTIPVGSTLTVEPGVSISFQGHYMFNVKGSILAVGSVGDSIFFSAPNSSIGWFGIRFDQTDPVSDSSKLTYCSIQNGNADSVYFYGCGGALFFDQFSKAEVTHCRIANNKAIGVGGGIYCSNSSPKFNYNTISGNEANIGGGIGCANDSYPVIDDNLISYNTASSSAGGIYGNGYNGQVIISNNIITHNNASSSVGGGIYLIQCPALVFHNTISYNSSSGGGGIKCYQISSPMLFSGNTISNNTVTYSGGGMDIEDCYGQMTLVNNTVTNNTATQNAGAILSWGAKMELMNNTIANNNAGWKGGALGFHLSPIVTIKNCILYGNMAGSSENAIYLDDENSDPSVSYCNIENGLAGIDHQWYTFTGSYLNNINVDPLFIGPSAGSGALFDGTSANWILQGVSNCIDAGDPSGIYPATDLMGNPRISNGLIDMGAYEYNTIIGIVPKDIEHSLLVYPNPFKSSTCVEFNTSTPVTDILLYNILGQIAKKQKTHQGDKIILYKEELPAGIYFLRLVNKEKVMGTLKVIIED